MQSTNIPVRRSGLGDFPGFSDPMEWAMAPFSAMPSMPRGVGTIGGVSELVMPMDVDENPASFVFMADLPGCMKEDISANVEDNILTITAVKKESCLHPGHGASTSATESTKGTTTMSPAKVSPNYHRRERAFGKISRSMRLPSNADVNKSTTTFNNGVLCINFPKLATSSVKRLPIG